MTRAEKIISFCEKYLVVPEGADVGKPMRLAEFQKEFIRAVYDNPHGTRRAICSIARKNGKSGLIAGLILAHLVGPEAKQNSQLVSGAMSRDQAALVFNLASKMVQQSPALSKIVRIVPSGKRLLGLPLNTEFRALAADGRTAHGLSPVLAILDEIGQIRGPQSDFVDAITTSQGAHADPLLIAISTQAANDADLLSQWIDDAKQSKDPRIVCHLYAAPKGCDLLDEDAWKAANPALGLFRSEDDLREQMQQAARMPSMSNTARNLLLNQRVSLDSPFISPDVWMACDAEPEPFDGPVYAGLDLSARTDLTALVLIGKPLASGRFALTSGRPSRASSTAPRKTALRMTSGPPRAICARHPARRWTMKPWPPIWLRSCPTWTFRPWPSTAGVSTFLRKNSTAWASICR